MAFYLLLNEYSILVHAMGSSLAGFSHLIGNVQRIVTNCETAIIEVKQCPVVMPHVTLLFLSDPAIAFSNLLMGFDCYLSLSPNNTKLKIQRSSLTQIFYACLSAIILNVVAVWLMAYSRKGVYISRCCYVEDIVPLAYYVTFYSLIALAGLLTATLIAKALRTLRLKRITSVAVQEIKLKRDATVLRRTVFTITFILLFQILPSLIAMTMKICHLSSHEINCCWLVCGIAYLAYASYIFAKDKKLVLSLLNAVKNPKATIHCSHTSKY
ncbi:hypothetical protein M514_04990 [Trichuris suis]|uniref:G-protein coupled receptors family 1 profile domain-containing protein n=1 Tax=Trichuris suis TaxID=68888 RepID=A0A085NNW9_9BILA|nr:hypothetical protein M513_04990 [Trichuris suis]KFD71165.1 hypothetical protein M514_04990 [Trichuris suis]KHJ48217.1 hypothetical protein D918_01485 [Trichuris suis]